MLEERVLHLEGMLSTAEQAVQHRPPAEDLPSMSLRGEPSMRHGQPLALGMGLLSASAAAEPHYFGFSAGLSLAHFVQVAIETSSNSSEVSLPLLADRPFSNQALGAVGGATSPAALPTNRAGASYIRAYLLFVHPLYPFLIQTELWQLHEQLTHVYQDGRQSQSSPQTDLALLHLVYAIGSRCIQLVSKEKIPSNTPEGHFLSAMKLVTEDLKFTSIRSIEVTLLLAIHSMRAPGGSSVWHLAGLAIRECLELGLHKQRLVDAQSVRLDQHRRRLFWSTYIFERKTALVLGRPFALMDEEIDRELPLNVDEEEHGEAGLVAALETRPDPLAYTALSFHRAHVELYQLHTQIRLTLYQMKRKKTQEQVRASIALLFEQLEEWHDRALTPYNKAGLARSPSRRPRGRQQQQQKAATGGDSTSARSSPDLSSRTMETEKLELLLEYYKARRSLLQPLMTEGRHVYQFDVADYRACADASGQICQIYRKLHRLQPVPFTLRDLHAVFVAGFTLIHCICACPAIYSASRAGDVGACSTVLYVISEQWASAKKYRDAFEVVSEKMMDSASRRSEMAAAGISQRTEGDRMDGMHAANSGRTRLGQRLAVATDQEQPSRSAPEMHAEDAPGGSAGSLNATLQTGPLGGGPDSPLQQHLLYESTVPGESNGPVASLFDSAFDLDSELHNIEGLLSNEGLDWFTEALW
jgi:hypothetical protein